MSLAPLRLRALLAEKQRRERARAAGGVGRVAELYDDIHPEALACVEDTSPLVAVCGTRRSGKSRSFIRKMAKVAATVLHGRVIYINETLAECESIAWIGNGRDGLLTLNEEFGLGGVPNHSKHTLTFPQTGGIIRLVGADDMRQINKLRGIAPHLVVLDEAQKAPHIGPLIQQSLGPAMMDHGGQLVMPGTPGIDLAGLFYDVTRDDGPGLEGWSVHRLNVLSNPFFGATEEERFERTIARYCREQNLPLDAPEVQREWFGRWVKTDARFVYAVHQVPEKTLCYAPPHWQPDGRPDIRAALADLPQGIEWNFTLCSDHGFFPDPFAYVLWAWSWDWDAVFEVCSWSQVRLDADEQLEQLAWVAQQVPISIVTGDFGGAATPMGKGWAKRWQERFQYGIVEAEKARKYEHQMLFNTDIRQGRVKMRLGSPLHKQAQTVVWLPQSGAARLREDPKYPNDITDAALYGHRHTAQHLAQRKPAKPEPGSAEYFDALEKRIEAEETEDGDDEATSYYS